MSNERIAELTKMAQSEDGCALKEALQKEDQTSHYEMLGQIVKHSAEQRKDDPSLPGISVMNLSDKTSSDQFVKVEDKTIYRRSFGFSLASKFANLIAGDVPENCDKKAGEKK